MPRNPDPYVNYMPSNTRHRSVWRDRWEDFKEYAPYLMLGTGLMLGAMVMGTEIGDAIFRDVNAYLQGEVTGADLEAKWVYVYDVLNPKTWGRQ